MSGSDAKLEQRARNVLLFQISKSAKTAHQLKTILLKREIPEEIAERIIERFIEVQLIDDRLFAVNFTAYRMGQHKSTRLIKRELQNKGVDQEFIDAALAEIDASQELEVATQAAIKRMRVLARLDATTRRRRLQSFLGRRGFAGQVISDAIRYAEHERLKSGVDDHS